MQSFNSSIDDWIQNFLSKPNKIFNNLPACPYAKKAWADNKVEVNSFDSWVDAYSFLITKQWDFTDIEVVIISFPHKDITPSVLTDALDKLTSSWKHDQLVVLEDHPDEEEQVQGYKLNYGKSGLILIQPRSKLNKARAYLESKGYYKNWDKEYKEEVQSR